MIKRMKAVSGRFAIVIALLGYTLAFPQGIYAEPLVSYLDGYPVISQAVDLRPIEEMPGIQMVPYRIMENPEVLNDALNGEVLQAQMPGRSPVSDLCSGERLTPDDWACSEFDHNEEVSRSSSDGITFREDCTIQIALATYPAFFHGGDRNGDGRIDIYDPEDPTVLPEWPDFANSLSGTTGSVEELGENVNQGDEFFYYAEQFKPPLQEESLTGDGSERTEARTRFTVSGDAVGNVDDDGPVIATDDCYDDPPALINDPEQTCASGKHSFDQTETLAFMTMIPDAEKTTARLQTNAGVCPRVEMVWPRVACINEASYQTPLVVSIAGHFASVFRDLTCIVRNDCYTNVHIYIYTDSLLGTNYGGGHPNMDFALDARNSGMRIPDPGRNCSSSGSGTHNACYEDEYVGTRGLCTVCGRYVGCTLVWKNWIKDDFDIMQAGLIPTDPDENPNREWSNYWDTVVRDSSSLPSL